MEETFVNQGTIYVLFQIASSSSGNPVHRPLMMLPRMIYRAVGREYQRAHITLVSAGPREALRRAISVILLQGTEPRSVFMARRWEKWGFYSFPSLPQELSVFSKVCEKWPGIMLGSRSAFSWQHAGMLCISPVTNVSLPFFPTKN